MNLLLKSIIVLISLFVSLKTLLFYFETKKNSTNKLSKFRLLLTGFVANVADTLGLGSFAVVVAFNNRWKMIDDKQLPGTLNTHSILPAMLQSLLFLKFVEIDSFLLISFILATCLGGLLSGFFVSKLNKRSIRFLMSIGFFGIALLILAHLLGLFPVAGDATSLTSTKMSIGIPAMVLVGCLPAIGVGTYIPTQIILFLLGLSPLVAFPIMTSGGVFAQSTSAYAFLKKKEVAAQESLFLSISGVLGVMLAVPLITLVNLSTLRWLLFGVVLYNGAVMWQHYKAEKAKLVKV